MSRARRPAAGGNRIELTSIPCTATTTRTSAAARSMPLRCARRVLFSASSNGGAVRSATIWSAPGVCAPSTSAAVDRAGRNGPAETPPPPAPADHPDPAARKSFIARSRRGRTGQRQPSRAPARARRRRSARAADRRRRRARRSPPAATGSASRLGPSDQRAGPLADAGAEAGAGARGRGRRARLELPASTRAPTTPRARRDPARRRSLFRCSPPTRHRRPSARRRAAVTAVTSCVGLFLDHRLGAAGFLSSSQAVDADPGLPRTRRPASARAADAALECRARPPAPPGARTLPCRGETAARRTFRARESRPPSAATSPTPAAAAAVTSMRNMFIRHTSPGVGGSLAASVRPRTSRAGGPAPRSSPCPCRRACSTSRRRRP